MNGRVPLCTSPVATIEAERVRAAPPLPTDALLSRVPGSGPTIAALLVAEIGDLAGYTRFSQLPTLADLDSGGVATGTGTGTAQIATGGQPRPHWAWSHAALGAARTAVRRARRDAMITTTPGRPRGLPAGAYRVGGEAPPPRLGRLAERAAL
jgi:hypothetical protein